MNRRWITRMAIQALALCLLLSTGVASAAKAARNADNQFGDQDRVTGNMIRALNAYAVYKMGQYESAFGQYLELAEEGSRQGMVNVANMYAQGQGVEKSQEKAFQWYVRAAESGDSISMVEVARAYDEGAGTDVDRHEAMHWYRKAAQAGNNDARWTLGHRLYDEGRRAEGLCLIQAAEQEGQPSAQQFLSALEQDTGLENTSSQLQCWR